MDILEILGALVGLIIIVLIVVLRGFLINLGLALLGLYGIYYAAISGEWGWAVAGLIAVLIGGFNVVTMISGGEMFDPWPTSNDSSGDVSTESPTASAEDSTQADQWDSSALDGDLSGLAKALIEEDPAYAHGQLHWVAKALINRDDSYLSFSLPLQFFAKAVILRTPSYAHGDLQRLAKALIEEDPVYAPGDLHYFAKAVIERDTAYL